MGPAARALILIIGMLLAVPLHAAAEVRDIPARPGITQRLLLFKPERPLAVLMVFAGGERALGIHNDGSLAWGGASLLIRTSPLFVQHGFIVAILDLPSDRLAEPAGNFRESADHARDIAEAIRFLRQTSSLPVWLIGSSSGTLSVLNAAINLQKNGADGIVLTSGIPADPVSLTAKLDQVRVPALVVRKGDPCHPYQQGDPDGAVAGFINAPKAQEITVQNMGAKGTDPCNAPPGHGYLGLENQFVDKISAWVKAVLANKDFI